MAAGRVDLMCRRLRSRRSASHGCEWREAVAESVNTTRAEALRPVAVAPRSSFRPSSRSRVRIAVGTLVVADRRSASCCWCSRRPTDESLFSKSCVIFRPEPRSRAGDLRSIELSTDPSLAVVESIDLAGVVGQYTKVRIVTGGLAGVGPPASRSRLVPQDQRWSP